MESEIKGVDDNPPEVLRNEKAYLQILEDDHPNQQR